MRRVDVGVKKANGNAVNVGRLQGVRRFGGGRLIKGCDNSSHAVKPLRYLETQIAGDQRWRRFVEKVVDIFPASAAKLQNIAKTPGRDKPDSGTILLNNRIDDQRRAVNDHVELRQIEIEFLHAAEKLLFQCACGTNFFDGDQARLRVKRHKVYKCAAYIHGQPFCVSHYVCRRCRQVAEFIENFTNIIRML